ncbi:unnamed protein product, partial [Pylaiella littoralis]
PAVHAGTTATSLPSGPPAPTTATAACTPDQAQRYGKFLEPFGEWRPLYRRRTHRRLASMRDDSPSVPCWDVVPFDPDVSGVSPATAVAPGAALTVVRGLQQPDMSVFVDEDLMAGFDNTKSEDYFPPILSWAEQLDAERMNVANAVLAPNIRPFTVGKPTKTVDINLFHVSLSHANETLLRATAA